MRRLIRGAWDIILNGIEQCGVRVFTVPTEAPESDGTAEWDSVTLVLAQVGAGDTSGLGYSYAHGCCAPLMREKLFPLIRGGDPMDIREHWARMNGAVRNYGRCGIAACAIAAVDVALWDLKARLLKVPLVKLAGAVRAKIPAYGSGGFTSYSEEELARQLGGWAGENLAMVKMKVGREPGLDLARVGRARKAIGDGVELFVDANGAYSAKQSAGLAQAFADEGVTWFEEPVSSDNLSGMSFVRSILPPGMELSAGEYNYDLLQAREMLESKAVDVLQADATRCGITGFWQVAELCEAFETPLSSHTAPALHAHLCCAARRARHAEYFHDHARMEQMLFEGATVRHWDGYLRPDLTEPGLGLELKERDAVKFEVKI